MPNPAIDVFSRPDPYMLQLPKRVYIVGSGPLGEEHWRSIPADAYVIACNKGAAIPQLYPVPWRVRLWVVSDMFVPSEPWFIDVPPGVVRLFGNQLIERGHEAGLCFDEEPWMSEGDVRPLWGKLRGGMIILGTALQLVFWNAHWHWPTDAVLCGFDLAGGARFGEEPVYAEDHWDWCLPRLDSFISTYLRGRVRSLSPTALPTVPRLGAGR